MEEHTFYRIGLCELRAILEQLGRNVFPALAILKSNVDVRTRQIIDVELGTGDAIRLRVSMRAQSYEPYNERTASLVSNTFATPGVSEMSAIYQTSFSKPNLIKSSSNAIDNL